MNLCFNSMPIITQTSPISRANHIVYISRLKTRFQSFDKLLSWEISRNYVYNRDYYRLNWDFISFRCLTGITSKLEYIKSLGVGAIWMSPMFQSPMYDFGYDIADFYAIHDEYGTMEDFDALMAKANELGKCQSSLIKFLN